jgi:hypothetical protein
VSSITRDFATRRSGAPERNAGVLLLHPASRSPAAAGPTTATTATERLVERCVATGAQQSSPADSCGPADAGHSHRHWR